MAGVAVGIVVAVVALEAQAIFFTAPASGVGPGPLQQEVVGRSVRPPWIGACGDHRAVRSVGAVAVGTVHGLVTQVVAPWCNKCLRSIQPGIVRRTARPFLGSATGTIYHRMPAAVVVGLERRRSSPIPRRAV